MKELTLGTLLAVFEEIFGAGLFWAMVVVAAAIGIAFLVIVLRDRTIEARRLVRAELWGPIGAIASVVFVMMVTDSRFRDIGGPVDVIVLLLIALVGGLGLTVLAYVAQGLRRRA